MIAAGFSRDTRRDSLKNRSGGRNSSKISQIPVLALTKRLLLFHKEQLSDKILQLQKVDNY